MVQEWTRVLQVGQTSYTSVKCQVSIVNCQVVQEWTEGLQVGQTFQTSVKFQVSSVWCQQVQEWTNISLKLSGNLWAFYITLLDPSC